MTWRYRCVAAVRMLSFAFLSAVIWAGGAVAHADEARPGPTSKPSPVTATDADGTITLDNGIVAIRIDKERGDVSSIRYTAPGKPVIELGEERGPAMYLDWNGGPRDIPPDQRAHAPHAGYGRPGGNLQSVRLAAHRADQADVALITRPYVWFPFAVEYHFVMQRGSSGFYAYAIYRHGKGDPAGSIGQTRFVIKGRRGTAVFTNHVVDDRRKGPFPTEKVIETVQDTTYRLADGRVYTKYDNSAFTRDYLAHGLAGHGVGIWMVWPSTEFLNGGPIRQDLTVHEENVLLAMFQSGHFGAPSVEVMDDEPWTHLYGPVFVYVNSQPSIDALWADVKSRAHEEQAKWPYSWLHNQEYPLARGTVTGGVKLSNGHRTAGAWAILAPGGENVDWAQSAKGYMFWTRVDADGKFKIDKVRPGDYNLFVSGADQPVDFQKLEVKVEGDSSTDLGELTWTPVTHGRTLWQIGTFDRSTDEFMDGADPRNYDTFLHYFKRFPDDVTFTIGQSHEATDWYYAQWNWYNRKPYWTIRFTCDKPQSGKATLTLGLASVQAHNQIKIALNGREIATLAPKKSGAAGYRSASCDSRYNLFPVEFDAVLLKPGVNEITLAHTREQRIPTGQDRSRQKRPPGDIMYDAIRLEVSP